MTLSVIWVLTSQTPEETSVATSAAIYAVDDLIGGTTSTDGTDSDADDSSSGDARVEAPRIIQQPYNVTARRGDMVTFSVEAVGAVSYQWECTDEGTDGWYAPAAGDPTSASLSFRLTSEIVWVKDCDFRCRVTFEDGSVEYSDIARIEYREMASWGPVARRLAHVAEFFPVGLFAMGLALALARGRVVWMRYIVAGVALFCLLCSFGDQVHKVFVPGREFDAADMALDAAGYGMGIALYLLAEKAAVARLLRGLAKNKRR